MKIVKIPIDRSVEFHYLKQGEVFLVNGITFIKIQEIKLAESNRTMNAVELEKGQLFFVADDTRVTPVEAKLTIAV